MHRQNPKDSTYKVARHTLISRNQLHFYANNELIEKEIEKTILFTIASKRIKYLEINLTKDVKVLYSENYKAMNKEIEEDTNKWKDTLCS